jgi:hypothetical protein
VWECRSALARSLIARDCCRLRSQLGFAQLLRLLLTVLLVVLGLSLRGCPCDWEAVRAHEARRREQQAAEAQNKARALLQQMRSDAHRGLQLLEVAKRHAVQQRGAEYAMCAQQQQLEQPGSGQDGPLPTSSLLPALRVHNSAGNSEDRSGSPANSTSTTTLGRDLPVVAAVSLVALGDHEPPAPCTPLAPAESSAAHHGAAGVDLARSGSGDDVGSCAGSDGSAEGSSAAAAAAAAHAGMPCAVSDAADQAFRCFVRAVHALQGLDLQDGTLPRALQPVNSDKDDGGSDGSRCCTCARQTSAAAGGDAAKAAASADIVPAQEQAQLFAGWSEAVLLKFFSCSCAGCTALALQTTRRAHVHGGALFRAARKQRCKKAGRSCESCQAQWHAVGKALARMVYADIALSWATDAAAPPCKAAVARTSCCLRVWDTLAELELISDVDDSGAGWTAMLGGNLVRCTAFLAVPAAAAIVVCAVAVIMPTDFAWHTCTLVASWPLCLPRPSQLHACAIHADKSPLGLNE